MKVLQINGVCKSGSTGKIVSGISEQLSNSGYESIICYSGNHENINQEGFYRIGSRLSTKTHQTMALIFGDAGFHSTYNTKKLLRYIESQKPDIVHLHNIYSYYLNVETLLKYLAKNKIKTVMTVHDCWVFTGHCTHFFYINCEKWQSKCFDCPLKKTYPHSLFFDRSKQLFERKAKLFKNLDSFNVVCVSNWLKGMVDSSFLKDFPNHVIYNGVDIERFSKHTVNDIKKIHNIEDKFVILGVSNGWGENKGLDKFLELAQILPNDMQIVLVGLSAEQISNLPKNIIGRQKTKNFDELIDYYSSADVFVSFSKQETMGMVVVEAMSCGLPAIVMPTTASPELVTKQTGFVNVSASAEECLKHIKTVQSNGKKHYGDACRLRAKDLFSAEKNYKKYVELYEAIHLQ